ncbi:uncharacterized protein [Eucyclogobius newberryi]|uniref:uncharacterized protein n=1 Tax=Eucyclogobius newberryi TaxID=166745 RepID=UPI003B595784
MNTSIKNDKIEENNSGTSALNVVERDLPSVAAKSGHINQLESNLSGLKVLISDLESTLTESVDSSSSQSQGQQTPTSQNDSVCSSGDVCLSQKSQSPDSIKRSHDKTSLMETEIVAVNSQLVTPMMTSRKKDHARLITTKSTRRPAAQFTLSTRLPKAQNNTKITQNNVSVSPESNNHLVKIKSRSLSLNQAYDVPSELWIPSVSEFQRREKKLITPESGGEGQGAGSKGKRRLQMTEVEKSASRPSSSTPKAAAGWQEYLESVMEKREQLRQLHSDQIRTLQNEHRRQQEQLLQELSTRCNLLHKMALPCSVTSRHEDTATFSTRSLPSTVPHLEHHLHLLVAVTKGFLTRRLLRTERVALLVRTAKDTQQFLLGFQKQSPIKGGPKEDVLLQERAKRQLRDTRYKIHDIFSRLSSGERMRMISFDRELLREREFKRQWSRSGGQKRAKSLSAATPKSLERNRSLMIKKKTVERPDRAETSTKHMPGNPGQYRPYLQRFPQSTYTPKIR